jgi:hypothetical protein
LPFYALGRHSRCVVIHNNITISQATSHHKASWQSGDVRLRLEPPIGRGVIALFGLLFTVPSGNGIFLLWGCDTWAETYQLAPMPSTWDQVVILSEERPVTSGITMLRPLDRFPGCAIHAHTAILTYPPNRHLTGRTAEMRSR